MKDKQATIKGKQVKYAAIVQSGCAAACARSGARRRRGSRDADGWLKMAGPAAAAVAREWAAAKRVGRETSWSSASVRWLRCSGIGVGAAGYSGSGRGATATGTDSGGLWPGTRAPWAP